MTTMTSTHGTRDTGNRLGSARAPRPRHAVDRNKSLKSLAALIGAVGVMIMALILVNDPMGGSAYASMESAPAASGASQMNALSDALFVLVVPFAFILLISQVVLLKRIGGNTRVR